MKYKIFRDVDSATSFSVILKLSIMLVLGFGYYRITMIIFSYFFLKIFLTDAKQRQVLSVFYAIILILALQSDLKYGQLIAIYGFEKFYHPIILFLIIDYTASNFVNRIIEYISGGSVFSFCKVCKFENVKLTSTCSNCGSRNIEIGSNEPKDGSSEINSKLELHPPLQYKLNRHEIDNLSLESYEQILACLKVSFVNGIYVDDVKKLCSYIVFTNKHLIFIEMLKIHRGWRYREIINLNLVDDIDTAKIKIGMSELNVVKITTTDHSYKFFISITNKPQEMYDKCVTELKRIILSRGGSSEST